MRLLSLLLLLLPLGCAHAMKRDAAAAETRFIQRMVEQHGFDSRYLQQVLADARYRQDIIDKISRPAERTLNWSQYRRIFLTRKRIEAGRRFMRRNHEALQRAERVYGVPPQIVTAIIGIETFYGRIAGKHRVLDALYTLAFHYPKRSRFFTDELEKFLLLTRQEGLDPRQPLGSYAGAMGLGQFMPSSYLAYAVDFDGDGKRDIWNDATDAIGSVANYFARHGWKRDFPVTLPAQGVDPRRHARFLDGDLKPTFTLAELRRAGIRFDRLVNDQLKASLVTLETDAGAEYWLGLNNFYVITRYNHSPMYAMAVYQLGEALAESSPEHPPSRQSSR